MILDCKQQCKLFFKEKVFNFHSYVQLGIDQLNKYITFHVKNIHLSHFHSHNCDTCRSPQLKLVGSYERHLVCHVNGELISDLVDIPVYYCKNCKHYHALLPSLLVIPYYQYSLSFILNVLHERLYRRRLVLEILEKYEIAKSTFYEWMKKFELYYHVWITFFKRPTTNFFDGIRFNIIEELCSFPEFLGSTLMQTNRALWKPP